jgi:hypothetical protein
VCRRVGTSVAAQAFQALGTWVDLLTQTYSVPPATMHRILHAATALATGPVTAPVRVVARLKGLLSVSSTWVSTGVATRIRTRALAAVVDSRPPARGASRAAVRRSWNALVFITAAARKEAQWWILHLPSLASSPIRPRPFDESVDCDIASDASDTGAGAFVTTRHGTPEDSSFLRALAALAPADLSLRALAEYERRGLEFMCPLPCLLLDASSTLRELWGIAAFITAVGPLLVGGQFRVFLDNIGCMFILGGVVPSFAVGGKAWGEFVSGGSPDPALQRLAVEIFDAQLRHGFTIQAVWRPRELNARADYLSQVSHRVCHASARLLPPA